MSVRLLMNELSHPPAAREHVVAALEAGAGALRALEAASASLGGKREERFRKQHIDNAIEHLQAALTELHASEEDEGHPGAAGFVLAVQRRRARDRSQSSPRTGPER